MFRWGRMAAAALGGLVLAMGVVAGASGSVLVPSAPKGVTATGGDGWIEVRWAAPEQNPETVTGYKVYRGAEGGSLEAIAETTAMTFRDQVANGQGFHYAVAAMAVAVEGARSQEVFARAGRAPDAPASLTGLRRGNGTRARVELRWEPPVDDGGAAVVAYRVHDLSGTVLATTSPDVRHYEGVSSHTQFAVTAVNAFGVGAPAWVDLGPTACEWC